ncbi:MAG: hypothetical protein V3T86_02115 [Planctomycetota bacterium]
MRSSARAVFILAICVTHATAEDNPKPSPVRPEPGPVDLTSIQLDQTTIAPIDGSAEEALAAFLEAHRNHVAKKPNGALHGYRRFLAHKGARDLPARYTTVARRRAKRLGSDLRAAFDGACALYRRDRSAGLAGLAAITKDHAEFAEGRAAAVITQSDRLLAAISLAKALQSDGKEDVARAKLKAAIQDAPNGLFLHEAKTLLIRIGGENLFSDAERAKNKADQDGKKEPVPEEEPEEETILEESEPDPE